MPMGARRKGQEEDTGSIMLASHVATGKQNAVESGRSADTARTSRLHVSTQMASETGSRSMSTKPSCAALVTNLGSGNLGP